VTEKILICHSNSDSETVEWGERIAAFLKEGDVLALVGELGSGKTWFTKGIARGLGTAPDLIVTSPSFALVNEYEGRCPIYHMDLFRLQGPAECFSSGLEEYLDAGGVSVVEWADRWPEIFPEYALRVTFRIIDDHRREITLWGNHPRSVLIIEKVEKEMNRG